MGIGYFTSTVAKGVASTAVRLPPTYKEMWLKLARFFLKISK